MYCHIYLLSHIYNILYVKYKTPNYIFCVYNNTIIGLYGKIMYIQINKTWLDGME